MRKIKIAQVDAFTDKLFGGNPAGVCFNANELTEEEMKKIAREMNLSETAFILAPQKAEADFKLRYFTPESEVNFCGHATVGTLYELARDGDMDMHATGEYKFMVETNIGVLEMKVFKNSMEDIKIEFTAADIKLEKSKYSHEEFSKKMGIPIEKINQEKPIMLEKTLNYLYITINSLKDLGELKFDFEKIKEEFADDGYIIFCLLTTETYNAENQLHTRGLAPLVGVNEDPVTGSMQGGLGAYCLENDIVSETEIGTEQGHFIHRPGNTKIIMSGSKDNYSAKVLAQAKHVFSTEIIL